MSHFPPLLGPLPPMLVSLPIWILSCSLTLQAADAAARKIIARNVNAVQWKKGLKMRLDVLSLLFRSTRIHKRRIFCFKLRQSLKKSHSFQKIYKMPWSMHAPFEGLRLLQKISYRQVARWTD